MAVYLALKEVLRNRGRFLLIALVVALITVLVLFIAALSQGLAAANREYIEKLNGELLVYQNGAQLNTTASRIGRSKVTELRRVDGVADVGLVGFSTAKVVPGDGGKEFDAALIGVDPGRPGEPEVFQGRQIEREKANETIIDDGMVARTGAKVGDTLRVKVTQGTSDEFYDLKVVGITDRRQYFFQPAIITSMTTWDKVRPQGAEANLQGELIGNIAVARLVNPVDTQAMATKIEDQVGKVDVVDRKTAWEALPGYAAQQSTLNTQRIFTFFIGVLVVGGFFQIQTLQKVAQIGMLKAIGLTNFTVVFAAIAQIVIVNAIGVFIGALGTILLTMSFPVTVPIQLTGQSVVSAVIALLLIGPIGGIVSVFALVRIEPLRALGMAQ